MENDVEGQDFARGLGEKEQPNSAHEEQTTRESVRTAHRRLVFTDPAAFRYLEEDPSVTVLERRRRLKGYELYIVEQWACSRAHPTFVITTYTGLEQHSVVVGVLSVPTDESAWSPRLRVYLKAITRYHARAKETPLGTLMVTNLSGFPSALTVILVPDGDLRNHRGGFIVNEDLKRLGCSGRAGMNLSPPIGATQAKFRELYHTSDQVPIAGAVVELVKLCQAALMLFGKLAAEYADGLLCDVTEQAINDWWASIGSDYFNIDPADGILGPTTVGALLGMLMGARNRLNVMGAPVAKDVFDLASTKRAIAYFQKGQKMDRTRRLDRPTLDRLHKVTAKAASSDGFQVPRAVKSTIAELSGKGGEMVNGRERAGIAEIETLDIDDFIRLGLGGRFKWLWYGKPRKEQNDPLRSLDDGLIFNDEEHGGGWTGKRQGSVEDDFSLRHTLSNHMYSTSHGSQTSINDASDPALRRTVLKNMTGKVSDARSGLGRIRDAVRRGHHHRPSKGNTILDDGSIKETTPRESVEQNRQSDPFLDNSPFGSGEQSAADSQKSSRRESQMAEDEQRLKSITKNPFYANNFNDKSSSSMEAPENSGSSSIDYMNSINHADGITSRPRAHSEMKQAEDRILTASDSRAIAKMEHFEWASSKLPPLRRTRSFSTLHLKPNGRYWERQFPRQMSFSALVDIVSPSTSEKEAGKADDPDAAVASEKILTIEAQLMETQLHSLSTHESSWVEDKVSQIEAFDRQCATTQAKIEEISHKRSSENHEMQEHLDGLLSERKASLNDAIKDVETLDAKLEYELQALQSKVEDVENGIDDFERQIIQLEAKAAQLDEGNEERISWTRWCLGFGIF